MENMRRYSPASAARFISPQRAPRLKLADANSRVRTARQIFGRVNNEKKLPQIMKNVKPRRLLRFERTISPLESEWR